MVCLLTILVIQVAIAIFAYVQKIDEQIVVQEYKKIFDGYYETEDIKKKLVDTIQMTLSCCGVKSEDDYREFNNPSIPFSCCGNPQNASCPSHGHSNHRKGCGHEIFEFFRKTLKTIGAVAIGVAVVEILGIIFSLCLANAIRNDERRGYRV